MQWFRNLAYVLFVIMATGYLLLSGQSILFPIFFGMFFSFMLMPLEGWIFRHIPNKFVSIVSSILLVLGVFSGLAFLFGNQLISIVSDMSSIQDQLKVGVQTLLSYCDKHMPFMNLHSDPESVNNMMNKIIQAPIEFVGSGITNIGLFLFNSFLTLIYIIFILMYKEALRDFLMIQFSKDKREELGIILEESVRMIQRYLVGMLTVVIILATMNCVGLLLLGVKYAIFWGILAACLVIIPYIGVTIGGTLPFLYSLATSDNSWQPWAVLGMYVVINQFEGNFITPKIVGSSVRINPFFALLGIVVMGELMGIGGIVLAIPTMAIVKLLAQQIDVLKPLALLMDKDLLKKRNQFFGKFDRENFRISSLLNEESDKR
ncbi:MAG: AI-2E family transporter [Saprospiraceae bacterium]|uniref:AI-2E family transporter n=1 Tax=Candidatus Opimibacter skivensis TaxID=2982028 RepID=A0A9D7XQ66_9BACT|nr:AI-2E family transporter [Candidatus Opimibacter skivensis]